MVNGGLGKTLSNPFALIGVLIGITVLVNVVIVLFPLLVAQFVSLGTLGNFTFSALFASAGLVSIILSAIILFAVL